MNLMGVDLTWALPLAFLALPLPVLAYMILPSLPERGGLVIPHSIAELLRLGEAAPRSMPRLPPAGMVARVLGWTALVVALAGPRTEHDALIEPTGRDLVVALDLSASMAEADMETANGKVPRIDIVRDLLGAFLERRIGDRIALIGFATEAHLIAPLSFDTRALATMLDELIIGLPGRRTDLGQPIGLTVQMFRDKPVGDRVLIVISDGETNFGVLSALDAAALAAAQNTTIHTIGFADVIETENAAHMRDVAQAAGGQYFSATSPEALSAIYDLIDRVIPAGDPEAIQRQIRDWRWTALLVSLFCVALIAWREARDT